MASSKRAQTASAINYLEDLKKNSIEFVEKKRAIERKYRDRGSSGEKQMEKELRALNKKYDEIEDKRYKKGDQDDSNIAKYGKDAMKGKSFASYSKGGSAKKPNAGIKALKKAAPAVAKKMGYSKGGMANCGASMQPTQMSSRKNK